MLRDRIIRLKDYGLLGIWMKADGDDRYNAGSILGYRGDDWKTIKKYSGLWKIDGRISPIETWQRVLKGIQIRRNTSQKLGRSIWFCFDRINTVNSLRPVRGSSEVDDSSKTNCTPLDQEHLKKINKFHDLMDQNKIFYATRFPPNLRNLIKSIEKLEDELEDEMASEEDFFEEKVVDFSKLEELFFSASKDLQLSIVKRFMFLNKVYDIIILFTIST